MKSKDFAPIKLGQKVKCAVTGIEGIVTARHQYLTGCTRISVQPKGQQASGAAMEWYTADEPQFTVLKTRAIKLPGAKLLATDPGGPGHPKVEGRR